MAAYAAKTNQDSPAERNESIQSSRSMCLDRPLKAIARLSMCPLFVSNKSPIANPIGVGMMKMANNAALAAVRHLIQAENAVASRESITSHEKLRVKIAFAIHQCSAIQPPPSRQEL